MVLKVRITKQGVRDLNDYGPRGGIRLEGAAVAPTLVIGCSDQLPNELRAYHFMGTSTEGAVLLSRHGATYSALASEVTAYPELLERMLGLVLAGFPPPLRERARPELISRWNRDWGVEAEDLAGIDPVPPANDNASVPVAESSLASSSPFEISQPTIEDHGFLPQQAALAHRAQAAAHG